MLVHNPTEITQEEAFQIIDTRKPLGMFFRQDEQKFIGLDNRSGDAWVEEFNNKETCFQWLCGEIEIDEI